ncbi:MAG: glycosyltransferase family 4 protein [Armatimonadota bacterium]
MTIALPLLLAAILSLTLTPLARMLAIRLDLLDRPVERSSHSRPIPFGGGFAIFVSFWVTVLVLEWPPSSPLIGMLIGSLILLVVCSLDDKYRLPAGPRLAAQMGVGLIAYGFGVRVVQVNNPLQGLLGPEYLFMGALEIPVTVLWIAFIINAVNWLDGLDGLAGGVSSIAAVTLALIATWGEHPTGVVVPAAALAGAALGFLRYNFNPASVFMGDVGAMFLGYMLACLSVIGAVKQPTALVLVVPLLVLGLPIYDSAVTILSRLRAGRPIHHPDRAHLHHRLLDSGLSTRETVLFMYGITGLLCMIALGVWSR